MKSTLLTILLTASCIVHGSLMSSETRYTVYAMNATESQMIDEVWNYTMSQNSDWDILAKTMLRIDTNENYSTQVKVEMLPRLSYAKQKIFDFFLKASAKLKKQKKDGEIRLSPMELQSFRRVFFNTFPSYKRYEEIKEECFLMSGDSKEFSDWYYNSNVSDITSTLKRRMKWGKLEETEKINWIFRYARLKNLMIEKSWARHRTVKRSRSVQTKGKNTHCPPKKPFKVDRRAISTK